MVESRYVGKAEATCNYNLIVNYNKCELGGTRYLLGSYAYNYIVIMAY